MVAKERNVVFTRTTALRAFIIVAMLAAIIVGILSFNNLITSDEFWVATIIIISLILGILTAYIAKNLLVVLDLIPLIMFLMGFLLFVSGLAVFIGSRFVFLFDIPIYSGLAFMIIGITGQALIKKQKKQTQT